MLIGIHTIESLGLDYGIQKKTIIEKRSYKFSHFGGRSLRC